jgi:hypothetical protein
MKVNREYYEQIMLSTQTALCDRIRPEMRVISIHWQGLEKFTMRVYFDKDPECPDYDDDLDDALAEINSHFLFKKLVLECIYSEEHKGKLKHVGPVVYSRKEATDE